MLNTVVDFIEWREEEGEDTKSKQEETAGGKWQKWKEVGEEVRIELVKFIRSHASWEGLLA